MTLITGANGFIGTYLVNLFIRKKTPFLAIERKKAKSERRNFINLDISKHGWTQSLPQKINAVIHLAQSSKYQESFKATNDIVAVNVMATSELLDWAYKNGVRKFIYTSTGNVYKPGKLPYREDMTCSPQGIYACSKYAAEVLCSAYKDKMSISIARLFGIYGRGQRRGLILDLIEKITNESPITIAGFNGLKINPLHAHDCARLLYKALKMNNPPNVFNLAGSRVLSIKQICKIISKHAKKQAYFKKSSYKSQFLVADNSFCRSHLKIQPKIKFEEGIHEMLLERSQN